MATHFEAISSIDSGIRHVGFDAGAKPDWFMIPLSQSKDIALLDAEGMTVSTTSPAVAEVVGNVPLFGGPSNRRLTIRGKQKGHTYLEVRRGKLLVVQLEISVKQLLRKSLAFNFVSDAPDASGAKHSTKHMLSEVDGWLKEINRIYTPQTNIEFVERSRRLVQTAVNLGDDISFDRNLYLGNVKDREEWDAVVAQKDRAADINIFLVWIIVCGGDPMSDACLGYHAFKDILVEDATPRVGTFSETIAHEIGHALGVVSHLTADANDDCLMFDKARGGTRIPKIHANIMNGPN